MKSCDESPFWDHVDGVFVVNLDDRNDRWEQVTEQLKHFIPEIKIERLSAVNGRAIKGFGEEPWFRGKEKDFRWAGRAGCTLSHRKAMEEGLKRGWNQFLVLEDDLNLRPVDKNFMDALSRTLFQKHTSWDLCYLGFSTPRGPAKTLEQVDDTYSFCRFRGARTTHAYLVKARLARWILESFPLEKDIWPWCASKRVVDRWYSRNISHHYEVTCVSPSLVVQAPSYSDLVGRVADDWDDSEWISSIPTEMCDPSFFGLRWCWSGLKCYFLNAFDFAKGLLKRYRGF